MVPSCSCPMTSASRPGPARRLMNWNRVVTSACPPTVGEGTPPSGVVVGVSTGAAVAVISGVTVGVSVSVTAGAVVDVSVGVTAVVGVADTGVGVGVAVWVGVGVTSGDNCSIQPSGAK